MPKKTAGAKKKGATRKSVQRENIFQDGPYLTAALLCEKILIEADNVKSAIRIVDKRTQLIESENPPAKMPPANIRWHLLVKLVKGEAEGKHEVSVRLVSPGGAELSNQIMTLEFEGADNTVIDLMAKLELNLTEEGTHWFEIYYDGILWTKSPLRTAYFMRRKAGSADPEQVH